MPYNDIVLRKESFGGIVGRRDGYGFHAINEAGFSLLERSADDLSAISFGGGSHAFANRLSSLGFLRGNAFIGEVIRNHNVVPYMSAPIRVWLEVTSRCNLTCRECFNEIHQDFKEDLSLTQIKAVLDDLYKSGVLQLTITGGEPLIRKDIWEILDYAFALGFGVRLFTNGTTLNEANATRLSSYPISHIFASLDGVGSTNDALRGAGTFGRISQGIAMLARKNANVTLSVTLHAHSKGGLGSTFDLAKNYGIRSLLIRPLLQYTDKANPICIKKSALAEFLAELEIQSSRTGIEYQLNKLPFFENAKSVFVYDRPTDVHFSYFTKHNQFGCVGGNTVVGIKSNGAIMACGFVDHKYEVNGNRLTETTFLDLWNNSNNVKVLRDRVGNEHCNKCSLLSVCGGGCRANALLHNGSLDAVDPYCFWGHPTLSPQRASSDTERDSVHARDDAPFISEKTIVTKCGSGSLL